MSIAVDCGFPGGNVIVDSIEGDTVHVHQDLRDTRGDWFYWYFRVRGAAGRRLTVRFTGSNPLTCRGPAVSDDDGRSWRWLGPVAGQQFSYDVPASSQAVRFCLAVPYLQADWDRFLARHRGDRHLETGVLCRSRKGRPVELLRAGRLDGQPTHRVLLVCRHHCCEMMASYQLEGILDAVLADTDDGRWFQRNVEVLAVPFMDKDGVEDGDQGKNRMPLDHNRDYDGWSVYPETRALRRLVPQWSQGKLRITLDLHCPWIRGGNNEEIYYVGSPDPRLWDAENLLAVQLERVRKGPLPFAAHHNLPFGKDWNIAPRPGEGTMFAHWAGALPGVKLATTMEFAYASAGGVEILPDGARAFGTDLAVAMRRFLEPEGV